MKFALPMFALAGAAILMAAGETPKKFTAPAGLQLYSLRDKFKQSIPETLDLVKKWGIKEVELAGTGNLSAADFRKLLDERGLKAVSGHWSFEKLESQPEAIAADAKTLGCKYVACAWIPHDKPEFTEADARRAIKVFNAAGEVMKKNGLQFCYHAHGYEFQKFGDGTLFDLLAREMKPGVADFQMDVFWIVHPGQDPVKLLEKYPNRFKMMHLKDIEKGAPTGLLSGSAPDTQSVALGTGQVNWPAVLKAAAKAGVEHYFIEDEAPKVEDQVPRTLEYLKAVSWE